MNSRVLLSATLLVAGTALSGFAQFVTEHYHFPVSSPAGIVPDTGLPLVFSETVQLSQIQSITSVRVGLHLTGSSAGEGWAGDMFVSLNRDLGSQTAILLNQVGVNGGNLAGFGYDGWNITFADDAVNGDVHLGQPAGLDTELTGEWRPDGRLNPLDVAGALGLNQFQGLAGDGIWNLMLTDLSPGGRMTLRGWSLELTGTPFSAVPEPGEVAVVTGAALAVFGLWRRRRV